LHEEATQKDGVNYYDACNLTQLRHMWYKDSKDLKMFKKRKFSSKHLPEDKVEKAKRYL